VVVVLFASACISSSPGSKVVVNGHSINVPTRKWTVLDAIKATGNTPREGMYTAAVSGHPVAPNGNPPKIEVDGSPSPPTARIRLGSKIVAVDGADTPEPVVPKAGYGVPPPLPPVMRELWHPGRGPVEQQMVGKLSGEVVSRTPVGPALPPAPETGKVIALSFDDGPDPRYTPSILQILKEEGVHATFCLVGYSIKRAPELVKAEVDAGHTLCNHTNNHAHMPKKSAADMQSEIADCTKAIVDASGQAPTLFRAPYGELSQPVIDAVHANNLDILQWNIDPSDFSKPASSIISARVLSHAAPGAVALMHDGGGDRSQTVAALRPIIEALKAQGYTFSTPALEPPVAAAP
jgi:peptidoglycan/xylan/chitin deacetylase (PgdA/CDA1 family)